MEFEKTIARFKEYKDFNRMLDGLLIIVREAQRRCPVDTGYLKKHWEITGGGSGGKYGIRFTADYAVYVHERLDVYHPVGEAKFLENAINAKMQEFLKHLLKG